MESREHETKTEVRDDGGSRLTWLATFAAVLFLALWGWTELRLRAEREAARSIEAEKGTLEGAVQRSAFRDKLHQRRSGIAMPELARVRLAPQDSKAEARGNLFIDHGSGRVFAFFEGLDASSRGMTHQLWFSPVGGPPESLGRFESDETGEAVLTTSNFPPEAASGEFRLTLEQAGGALVPTGREILRGSLAPQSPVDPEAETP